VLPNASGTNVRLAGAPLAISTFCPAGWIEVVGRRGRPTDRELKLVQGGRAGPGLALWGSQNRNQPDLAEADGGMIL